eukprot:TRINITY_DN6127_c0_g1_i1.p1 TRINITY_DN6127_c0_g1~~TRINITY_DN6127_c0_g1_i1.p1  ORF type:complete len:1051 (+),score=151.36 TRINITY_DN6127_c0_g1_i1:56-3154(+)
MPFVAPVARPPGHQCSPGDAVEVAYAGGWYPASVRCVLPDGSIDADWGDGTFAPGVLPGEFRPLSVETPPWRDRGTSPPRDPSPAAGLEWLPGGSIPAWQSAADASSPRSEGTHGASLCTKPFCTHRKVFSEPSSPGRCGAGGAGCASHNDGSLHSQPGLYDPHRSPSGDSAHRPVPRAYGSDHLSQPGDRSPRYAQASTSPVLRTDQRSFASDDRRDTHSPPPGETSRRYEQLRMSTSPGDRGGARSPPAENPRISTSPVGRHDPALSPPLDGMGVTAADMPRPTSPGSEPSASGQRAPYHSPLPGDRSPRHAQPPVSTSPGVVEFVSAGVQPPHSPPGTSSPREQPAPVSPTGLVGHPSPVAHSSPPGPSARLSPREPSTSPGFVVHPSAGSHQSPPPPDHTLPHHGLGDVGTGHPPAVYDELPPGGSGRLSPRQASTSPGFVEGQSGSYREPHHSPPPGAGALTHEQPAASRADALHAPYRSPDDAGRSPDAYWDPHRESVQHRPAHEGEQALAGYSTYCHYDHGSPPVDRPQYEEPGSAPGHYEPQALSPGGHRCVPSPSEPPAGRCDADLLRPTSPAGPGRSPSPGRARWTVPTGDGLSEVDSALWTEPRLHVRSAQVSPPRRPPPSSAPWAGAGAVQGQPSPEQRPAQCLIIPSSAQVSAVPRSLAAMSLADAAPPLRARAKRQLSKSSSASPRPRRSVRTSPSIRTRPSVDAGPRVSSSRSQSTPKGPADGGPQLSLPPPLSPQFVGMGVEYQRREPFVADGRSPHADGRPGSPPADAGGYAAEYPRSPRSPRSHPVWIPPPGRSSPPHSPRVHQDGRGTLRYEGFGESPPRARSTSPRSGGSRSPGRAERQPPQQQQQQQQPAARPRLPSVVALAKAPSGFRVPLCGRYRRVPLWPSDQQNAVDARYRSQDGRAVLFRRRGVWHVNDSDSTSAWVYSSQKLTGQWAPLDGVTDYGGERGLHYPVVRVVEQARKDGHRREGDGAAQRARDVPLARRATSSFAGTPGSRFTGSAGALRSWQNIQLS